MTRDRAAAILEAVARGEMEAHDALKEWPDTQPDDAAAMKAGWHELWHFTADADIRARDAEYDEHQRGTLLQLAETLRSS